MLNVFPELLTLSFFAPLVLRIAVGGFFFLESRRHAGVVRKSGTDELRTLVGGFAPTALALIALLEISVAVMLVVGFLTQIAAMAGFVLAIVMLLLSSYTPKVASRETATYMLVTVICLSLLATGAGALAFDLPL